MAERSTARFADRTGRHRIEPEVPEMPDSPGRRRGHHRFQDEPEPQSPGRSRSHHRFEPEDPGRRDVYHRFEDGLEPEDVGWPHTYDRFEDEPEPEPEGPARHRGYHRFEDDTDHAGPGSRRKLWLIAVGGPALGIALCGTAFMFGPSDPPPTGTALPPPAPITTQAVIEEPSLPSVIPSTLPMPEQTSPSAKPSASVSPTPAPTTPGSPSPALLGPSSRNGVENLVQRYCDRHSGGSADTRGDGRWECQRLLSSSIVDMNVACQDTYGSGASARNPSPGDPYAWRCYR